jgi:hypothetical protein
MPVYRRPNEIAGYQPRGSDTLGRVIARELTAAAVIGAVAGAVLMTLVGPHRILIQSIMLALGLAAGGRMAELVFFHRVGTRLPDPFGPAAYLVRTLLWAVSGGVAVWFALGLAAFVTGAPLPGGLWFAGGAALNVLVQAPYRLWTRRRDQRVLARLRR